MFCCKCGVRNPGDANYCHECGSPLSWVEAEDAPRFVPYEVYIRPNFYSILADFDLVKDTKEAWDIFGSHVKKLPKSPWNIWGGLGKFPEGPRNLRGQVEDPYWGGFTFSFISPQVIYKPALNSFASEVDLSASLEPAGIRREIFRDEAGVEVFSEIYFPSLNLRSSGGGYRLSLSIPEMYWSRIQHKDVFSGIASKDLPRHSLKGDLESWGPAVEVPLAVVPYEEFEVHFAEGASPLRYQLPRAFRYTKEAYSEAVERRTKARARHGLTGQTGLSIDGKAPDENYSDFAEHRYLLVIYGAL